jgi:hypothetical protein
VVADAGVEWGSDETGDLFGDGGDRACPVGEELVLAAGLDAEADELREVRQWISFLGGM